MRQNICLSTVASIWHENNHKYLSTDIICSLMQKTVSFKEQVIIKDNYTSKSSQVYCTHTLSFCENNLTSLGLNAESKSEKRT